MTKPDDRSARDRILDTAQDVLRRHGAEKANVVDIARALGMSHGNIYRHFPSKKALLDAVAIRWLNAVTLPLAAIANDRARSPSERLEAWFNALRASKRKKVRDDPELFQVHHNYVKAMRDVVDEHVAKLLSQLETIIADGIKANEFARGVKPTQAARAFLQATAAFHHPTFLMQDPQPTDADARAVIALLLSGLRAGTV